LVAGIARRENFASPNLTIAPDTSLVSLMTGYLAAYTLKSDVLTVSMAFSP
jgi:hypothetical protein